MENIIANYNPTIINYIHGDITDNILNNYPIFVINLKDNIERRNYINFIMRKMKVNYNLVMVDKIDSNIYDKIGKQNIKTDKNKLGCILSHLFCIKLGIDSNYNKFIIFEDDIIFHKQFNELCTLDLLNVDFDMLMLGACDFNLNSNKILIHKKFDNLHIYKPSRQALGAHANIYSISFAKTLYDFKMKTPIFEFDADFKKFYQKNNIYISMPNLVVCELTTTNLNHQYGYESIEHNKYINQIFPTEFTYKNYKYITIHFINYVKDNYDSNQDFTLNHIVNKYIKLFNISESMKITLTENLTSSDYSIEDIKNMYSSNNTN
jgi:GR25 family glycosyltransferase involved in LPS biosynthesis